MHCGRGPQPWGTASADTIAWWMYGLGVQRGGAGKHYWAKALRPVHDRLESLKKMSCSLVRTNWFCLQAVDGLGRVLSPGARQALTLILGGCMGCVFSAVELGSITRLILSGQSMIDWSVFRNCQVAV